MTLADSILLAASYSKNPSDFYRKNSDFGTLEPGTLRKAIKPCYNVGCNAPRAGALSYCSPCHNRQKRESRKRKREGGR